jgi:hypothetical protein
MAPSLRQHSLLTILTFLTIGAPTALLIALIVCFNALAMKDVHIALWVGVIIAMVVSLLILAYGIYASCFGGSCQKGLMTVIFGVYGVVVVALGIGVLAFKSQLVEGFKELWNDPIKNAKAISTLETGLDCSGWDNSSSPDDIPTCETKIRDYYTKYGSPAGGVLLGLGLLLLVGVGFAIKFICSASKDGDTEYSNVSGKSNVTTPLTYGW